jgi:DNA (cytosine-5)-methyltransferase 1
MGEMGKGILRQLDLCSPIGAGFPFSGIITGKVQLCGLCEIDSFCKEILQKRFPGVPIYNSVRDLGIHKEEINTITASPPCQPFSVEGKRLGGADERDCIPAVLRLVARIQPKFFCLENVPGLLSAPQYPGNKPGTYFLQMLRQLHECGYNAVRGLLSEHDFASEPNGREKDSYSLPRPGALSWSGKGRPPGNTKSEAKAKKLGLIGKKEVFNPEWLELQFGLPIGWTSLQEHRAATELLALAEQPLEIV